MLLRLIPEPPVPTILFSLDFFNPNDTIPIPAFWGSQLHLVVQDELEMPPSLLGLDKAAWSVALLKEVNFNIVTRMISIVFADNAVKEWYLEDVNLLQALNSILDVVRESSVAAEMEQARARALSTPPSRPGTPSSQVKRHRKSRSLFQSIVA